MVQRATSPFPDESAEEKEDLLVEPQFTKFRWMNYKAEAPGRKLMSSQSVINGSPMREMMLQLLDISIGNPS